MSEPAIMFHVFPNKYLTSGRFCFTLEMFQYFFVWAAEFFVRAATFCPGADHFVRARRPDQTASGEH